MQRRLSSFYLCSPCYSYSSYWPGASEQKSGSTQSHTSRLGSRRQGNRARWDYYMHTNSTRSRGHRKWRRTAHLLLPHLRITVDRSSYRLCHLHLPLHLETMLFLLYLTIQTLYRELLYLSHTVEPLDYSHTLHPLPLIRPTRSLQILHIVRYNHPSLHRNLRLHQEEREVSV